MTKFKIIFIFGFITNKCFSEAVTTATTAKADVPKTSSSEKAPAVAAASVQPVATSSSTAVAASSQQSSASPEKAPQPAPVRYAPIYVRDADHQNSGALVQVGWSPTETNVYVYRDDKYWYYVPVNSDNMVVQSAVRISETPSGGPASAKQGEQAGAASPVLGTDAIAAIATIGSLVGGAALAAGGVAAGKAIKNKIEEGRFVNADLAVENLAAQVDELKKNKNRTPEQETELKARTQELNEAKETAKKLYQTKKTQDAADQAAEDAKKPSLLSQAKSMAGAAVDAVKAKAGAAVDAVKGAAGAIAAKLPGGKKATDGATDSAPAGEVASEAPKLGDDLAAPKSVRLGGAASGAAAAGVGGSTVPAAPSTAPAESTLGASKPGLAKAEMPRAPLAPATVTDTRTGVRTTLAGQAPGVLIPEASVSGGKTFSASPSIFAGNTPTVVGAVSAVPASATAPQASVQKGSIVQAGQPLGIGSAHIGNLPQATTMAAQEELTSGLPRAFGMASTATPSQVQAAPAISEPAPAPLLSRSMRSGATTSLAGESAAEVPQSTTAPKRVATTDLPDAPGEDSEVGPKMVKSLSQTVTGRSGVARSASPKPAELPEEPEAPQAVAQGNKLKTAAAQLMASGRLASALQRSGSAAATPEVAPVSPTAPSVAASLAATPPRALTGEGGGELRTGMIPALPALSRTLPSISTTSGSQALTDAISRTSPVVPTPAKQTSESPRPIAAVAALPGVPVVQGLGSEEMPGIAQGRARTRPGSRGVDDATNLDTGTEKPPVLPVQPPAASVQAPNTSPVRRILPVESAEGASTSLSSTRPGSAAVSTVSTTSAPRPASGMPSDATVSAAEQLPATPGRRMSSRTVSQENPEAPVGVELQSAPAPVRTSETELKTGALSAGRTRQASAVATPAQAVQRGIVARVAPVTPEAISAPNTAQELSSAQGQKVGLKSSTRSVSLAALEEDKEPEKVDEGTRSAKAIPAAVVKSAPTPAVGVVKAPTVFRVAAPKPEAPAAAQPQPGGDLAASVRARNASALGTIPFGATAPEPTTQPETPAPASPRPAVASAPAPTAEPVARPSASVLPTVVVPTPEPSSPRVQAVVSPVAPPPAAAASAPAQASAVPRSNLGAVSGQPADSGLPAPRGASPASTGQSAASATPAPAAQLPAASTRSGRGSTTAAPLAPSPTAVSAQPAASTPPAVSTPIAGQSSRRGASAAPTPAPVATPAAATRPAPSPRAAAAALGGASAPAPTVQAQALSGESSRRSAASLGASDVSVAVTTPRGSVAALTSGGSENSVGPASSPRSLRGSVDLGSSVSGSSTRADTRAALALEVKKQTEAAGGSFSRATRQAVAIENDIRRKALARGEDPEKAVATGVTTRVVRQAQTPASPAAQRPPSRAVGSAGDKPSDRIAKAPSASANPEENKPVSPAVQSRLDQMRTKPKAPEKPKPFR